MRSTTADQGIGRYAKAEFALDAVFRRGNWAVGQRCTARNPGAAPNLGTTLGDLGVELSALDALLRRGFVRTDALAQLQEQLDLVICHVDVAARHGRTCCIKETVDVAAT